MGSKDSGNSDFLFPLSSPSLSSQDGWDDDLHAYLGWCRSHELNLQTEGSSSLVPDPSQSTSENLTFSNSVSMGQPLLQTGVNDFVNDFSQGQISSQILGENVGSPNVNPQIFYPQQQSVNPTEGFYPQQHSANPAQELVLNNSPQQNRLKEDSFSGGVDDYSLSCVLSQSVNSHPNKSAEQPKGKLSLLPSRSGSNRSDRAKPYDRAPPTKGSKHVKEITQGTRQLFASPSWHKDGNFSDLLHGPSRLSRTSSSGNLTTTMTVSGASQPRMTTLQPNPGTRISSSSGNLSSSRITTSGTSQPNMMTTSGTLQPNPGTRIPSPGHLSTPITVSGTSQPNMMTTSGTLQPNPGTRISSSGNMSTTVMASGTLQPRMVTTSGTFQPNTGKRISSSVNLSTKMLTSATSQSNPGTRIPSSSGNLSSTMMTTSGTLQPRMMTTSGTLQPNPGTSSKEQGIHDRQGSSSFSGSQDGRITRLATQTSRQESKKGGAPGGNSQKQDNTNCGLNQELQQLEESVALYLAWRYSKNRDPANQVLNQIPSSSLPESFNPRMSHNNLSFHCHGTNDVALANLSLNQNLNSMSHGNSSFHHHETNQNPISSVPETSNNPMFQGNFHSQHDRTEDFVLANQSPSQRMESETNCVPSLEDQEEKSDFLMWTEQQFMETEDQNTLDF